VSVLTKGREGEEGEKQNKNKERGEEKLMDKILLQEKESLEREGEMLEEMLGEKECGDVKAFHPFLLLLWLLQLLLSFYGKKKDEEITHQCFEFLYLILGDDLILLLLLLSHHHPLSLFVRSLDGHLSSFSPNATSGSHGKKTMLSMLLKLLMKTKEKKKNSQKKESKEESEESLKDSN